MPFVFNPFTGNLDAVTGGNGVQTYSTFSGFPASAPDGSLAVALDTDTLYVFNTGSSTWFPIGKPGDALSVGTYDSGTPSGNGIQINGAQAIIAQSASTSNPGMVNTTTQSFAGNKTFTGTIGASNLSGTNTGDQTITLTGGVTGSGTGSFAATVITNANLTGPITSVGNATSVASQTGTGSTFVMNTSPTLITPNIGAATGSSLSVTGQLTSTVATGTAPLVVSSTTQVANLNAATAGSFSGSLSGDVTGTQSATVVSKIQGTTVSGTTGSGNVVFSTSPSLVTPSFSSIVNGGTLTLPTSTDTLVGRNTTDVLTNKSLSTTGFAIVDGTDNTKKLAFNISGFNTGVTLTLTATVGSTLSLAFPSGLGSGDALVSNNTSATLLNKKLSDSSTTIVNNIDPTKVLAFSTGSSAASTTLTLTTGQSTTQSLAIPNVSSGDSLVTNNTTATLTNKTIAAGSNTITGLTNTNLSGSAAISNANLAAMAANTVKANTTGGSATPTDVAAVSTNTPSSFVVRDSSGNFSAGTITATLSGSASGNLAKATGDIDLTTFAPANNQASPANVTGLAFANASVESAIVFYSVVINATTPLYERGTLNLVQKASSWDMAQTFNGDNSLVVFTVTAAGQVQYTTPNYAGFTSAKMGFRALVTNV
jgi:hypothetical protein